MPENQKVQHNCLLKTISFIPKRKGYKHNQKEKHKDKNSPAHLKSTIRLGAFHRQK